jgi:hypothetical protein
VPPLAEIQASFARALRDPATPVPEFLRGAPGARRRFDVYRNNVAVSLTEALEAAFPVVLALVGRDFFRAAARAYIDRHPPETPVLLLYGQSFGTFLDGFPPAAPAPYLGDVARLEWARLAAHHAADAASLGIDALAALPRDRMAEATFELHPSLAVIRSRWPVFSIWAESADPGRRIEVDMKRAEDALVGRPDQETSTRLLPAGGAAFMAALGRGETLEAAANRAAESMPDFDLAYHLRGMFEAGAVVGVRCAANTADPWNER